MQFLSPLRYPGGKRKLANFIKLIYLQNNLVGGEYVEPYAGGASVALALLYDEYVRRVHINDYNRAIYAFWYGVLNRTDELCRLIRDTSVTIEEWSRQKLIQITPDAPLLELGFSTFFLNRTNRSGIVTGGVIGGKEQTGEWTLDARYNKEELIARIQKVARYRTRISLTNEDAEVFIPTVVQHLPINALVYLDPPYFDKGQEKLYTNYYKPEDHARIARLVDTLVNRWVVSYDNVNDIVDLYDHHRHISYGINYSAQVRYLGSEIMFFSEQLQIPEVRDPTKLTAKSHQQFLL